MPFHFLGGGPNPSSLKLSAVGVIPTINLINNMDEMIYHYNYKRQPFIVKVLTDGKY